MDDTSSPTKDHEPEPSGIRIVRVGAERLDDLSVLWGHLAVDTIAAAPGFGPGLDLESSWQRARAFHRRRLEQPGSFLLLAFRAEFAIGYTLVAITERPSLTWELDDRRAEMDFMCVLPEERGRGVGSSLMAAAKQQLRLMGIDRVSLTVLPANEGARRFYERHRFAVTLLTMTARF
jgi:ribosomal protein S18 acetylase RimI-like enzyme